MTEKTYPPLPGEPVHDYGTTVRFVSETELHAYADAAREGWLSPEEAADLRGLVADMQDNRITDAEVEKLRKSPDDVAERLAAQDQEGTG